MTNFGPQGIIEPQIWSSVIRSLQVPLSELQVKTTALLAQCNIDESELEHPHGQVPLSSYLNFLNQAAIDVDDPLLSVKLSKSVGPELLGALGFLFLSSRKLYDAIHHMCHYQNLFQESTYMNLVKGADVSEFHYELYGMGNIDTRLDVEFSIAFTARLIRLFSDNKVDPVVIHFRHAPSAPIGKYQQLLNCPCRFGQDSNTIFLRSQDLLTTGSRYDVDFSQILIDYLDKDLASKTAVLTFTDQVSKTILHATGTKLITAKVVANELGMSSPTLYRRLREEGTTFKKILAQLHYDMACKYLRETKLNINQISQLLGFSSSSGFTRAFLAWSRGNTPKQYREAVS